MLAQKRLENLEGSLQCRPEVARKYDEVLSSHLKEGYIRKLIPEESLLNQNGSCHISLLSVKIRPPQRLEVYLILQQNSKDISW